MVKIYVMRQLIKSGHRTYPVFIGFMNASLLSKLATAPAFLRDTPNQSLAHSILNRPVRDWQRPLDEERVDKIKQVYDDTGEFMPNPVLLAENAFYGGSIKAIQHVVASGETTMVWEIEIPEPQGGDDFPLWILDGQHRINGLSRSKQGGNEIPFVLLFNGNGKFYQPEDLAKIFAQVTTSAAKLDPLHNEWLTYAYKLDQYGITKSSNEARSHAMEVAAHICDMQSTSMVGVTNPFYNHVRFNYLLQTRDPLPRGFGYSCLEFVDLVLRNYYSCSPQLNHHLAPKRVAEQLVLAHDALQKVVAEPKERTVFFGDSHHGQKIMQDAYIVGVLSSLLANGEVTDWVSLLKSLNFHTTQWEFTWTKSLHGAAQANSKKLANNVFARMFRNHELPDGAVSIADYLRGNQAMVKFTCSRILANGKVSKRDQIELVKVKGASEGIPAVGYHHFRCVPYTDNIVKVEVTDRNSPPGKLVTYTEVKNGIFVDASRHKNPLELLITLHHYGNVKSTLEIDLQW